MRAACASLAARRSAISRTSVASAVQYGWAFRADEPPVALRDMHWLHHRLRLQLCRGRLRRRPAIQHLTGLCAGDTAFVNDGPLGRRECRHSTPLDDLLALRADERPADWPALLLTDLALDQAVQELDRCAGPSTGSYKESPMESSKGPWGPLLLVRLAGAA